MSKQQKKRRRMVCPNCRSYQTKKNGKRTNISIGTDRKTTRSIQRYYCKSCKRSFIKRRDKDKQYSRGFRKEIIRMHLEQRMSFRVISKILNEEKGIKTSPSYICKLFNEEAKKVKSSFQIKNELFPEWSGYLIVDDKMINIKGDKKVSLIAKDNNGDIVHEELLDYPDQSSYDEFFMFIKDRLEYNFNSVTTDLDPKLARSIRRVLGEDIPHQKCLKHALDNIMKIVKYNSLRVKRGKLEKKYTHDFKNFSNKDHKELKKTKSQLVEIDQMMKIIKRYLWMAKKSKSEVIYQEVESKYSKIYPRVIYFLKINKKELLTHQGDKEIPKTNNDAENTNRQIMRRLKTIESFQTEMNAYNYLILFCNYLRMKPYTDCRKMRKYRNGKTPLQLAGVNFVISDWVKFSLNY
jgi:transposase-like protein